MESCHPISYSVRDASVGVERIENDTKSQSVAIKLQLSKLNHSERERERD